jgi:hypothetical protein
MLISIQSSLTKEGLPFITVSLRLIWMNCIRSYLLKTWWWVAQSEHRLSYSIYSVLLPLYWLPCSYFSLSSIYSALINFVSSRRCILLKLRLKCLTSPFSNRCQLSRHRQEIRVMLTVLYLNIKTKNNKSKKT